MEDSSEPGSKVRKTVSFTHKQLGIGGCVITAALIISPLKGFFFTREEGNSHAAQLEEIKKSQTDGFKSFESTLQIANEEQTRRLERVGDKIVERIKEVEARTVRSDERLERNDERLERRIENLEFVGRIPKPKLTN
jgi:gas vesicle protein